MPTPRPRSRRLITNTAALSVLMLVFLVAQHGFGRTNTGLDHLGKLIDIRHQLSRSYVEPIEDEAIINAAIRGMLDELNDPYTTYFTQAELDEFQESVTGEFVGIGAEVDIHRERLRIVAPLEESPAWQAGVKPGDIVLAIEGEDTLGMKLTDAIKRLKGEEGTQVTITVRHRTGDEQDITITRGLIKVNTVRGVRRLADQHFDYMLDKKNKVGYLRLSQFGERTARDIRQAVNELKEQGVRALIFDVRFNPGGLLEQAHAVSDMFLTNGKRILSVKGRSVREKTYESTSNTLLPDMPVVILINGNSASASEILAGAIKDNGRGLLVGTRTFGKGSVQQLRPLDDGLGALKITNAYYYIPSGTKIHRTEDAEQWGVDPSAGCYVPMHPDDIEAMIEARREEPSTRPYDDKDADNPVTPEFLRETIMDPQLAAALQATLGYLANGAWPEVGGSNTTELVKTRERQDIERRIGQLEEAADELREKLAELDVMAVEMDESEEQADEPAVVE